MTKNNKREKLHKMIKRVLSVALIVAVILATPGLTNVSGPIVDEAEAASISLSAGKSTFLYGENVNYSISGDYTTLYDWVAVYEKGSSNYLFYNYPAYGESQRSIYLDATYKRNHSSGAPINGSTWLPPGEYTIKLHSGGSGYPVMASVNFTIKGVSVSGVNCATANVTSGATTTSNSFKNMNTWIGLFKSGDNPKTAKSIAWYYLTEYSNEAVVNVVNATHKNSTSDYKYGGSYKVVLFADSTNSYPVSTSSTFTVSNHNAGAAATCTTAQKCTVCSATIVAAKGHKAGAAATCTTAQKCTVCSATIVAALGHNYSTSFTTDKEATCTTAGSKSKHCSRCTSTKDVTSIPALGHDFSSKTISDTYLKSAATCKAAAVYYYKCSRCTVKGTDTYSSGSTNASNHAGSVVTSNKSGDIHSYYNCCDTVVSRSHTLINSEVGTANYPKKVCACGYKSNNLNTYMIDVNNYVDGANSSDVTGSFDVYINGELVTNRTHPQDYYVEHTHGTTYKVNNIIANNTFKYVGTQREFSGTITGPMTGTNAIILHWTKVTNYWITFDPNGGALPSSGYNVYNPAEGKNHGNTVPVIYGAGNYWAMVEDVPSRPGYEFLGWYDHPTSGNGVYDENGHCIGGKYWTESGGNGKWNYTDDLTVYAHWKKNPDYTLTLNPNDGTTATTTTMEYGLIKDVPKIERPGYELSYWYAKFTGDGYLDLGRDYMYDDKISIHLEAYMDNWADYSKANANQRLISCTQTGGWNIENGDGFIRFATYDDGRGNYNLATSEVLWSSLKAGWHTFDMVFDGNKVYGYLDGELIATSEAFVANGTTGEKKIRYNVHNSILLGAEAGSDDGVSDGYFFDGYIRNVVIEHSDQLVENSTNKFIAPAQNLTLYAEWEPGKYNVNVSVYINADTVTPSHGNPAAVVKLSGNGITSYRAVEFTPSIITRLKALLGIDIYQTVTFEDVPIGNYTVTQVDTYRYEPGDDYKSIAVSVVDQDCNVDVKNIVDTNKLKWFGHNAIVGTRQTISE